MSDASMKLITEEFFKIEKNLGLFHQTIDNVYFWEYIRYPILNRIFGKLGIFEQGYINIDPNRNYKKKKFNRQIKNIYLKNPFLSPRCDILFWGVARRNKMHDGLWWDIYCDLIIKYLSKDKSCLLLEMPYQNQHFTPSATPVIRCIDLIQVAGAILKKVKIVRVYLSAGDYSLLKRIEKEIQKSFNVTISDLSEIVKNLLVDRKSMLPMYQWLLNKIRPKLVVVVNSYVCKVFIEACKWMAIPVAELQHGNISKYHLAYSFPDASTKVNAFPDYFLSFGDFWNGIVEFPIMKEKILSVGFPHFEREALKYSKTEKKNQIVLLSQGTIGKEMSKFAVELNNRNDFSLDIVYKLHPDEFACWKKEYPWLVNNSIQVIDDNSIPLYQVLAESIAQVGVYSTAVYEGLGFGLKTFLLDFPGVENMNEIITNGSAIVISTTDELLEKMWQIANNQINPDIYFKSNALENISCALNDIYLAK